MRRVASYEEVTLFLQVWADGLYVVLSVPRLSLGEPDVAGKMPLETIQDGASIHIKAVLIR